MTLVEAENDLSHNSVEVRFGIFFKKNWTYIVLWSNLELEKGFLGEIEKAFVAAVSRLGKYPIVGGLTFRWENAELAIDSDLTLFDETLHAPFPLQIP